MILRNVFLARFALPLAALLAMTLVGSVRAGNEKSTSGPSAAADPVFDRYVDLNMLTQAWVDKNAPLLTDLGLQLAEGERVLFRTHKSISADQVLSMAAKVAAEKKDTKTLDRLARALDALKKTDLAAQVASAQKLSLVSRAPDAALAMPADKLSQEVFLLFRDTLDNITAAKIDGDGETLDIIIQLTPKMTRIPDAQRKYLVKTATQARAALGTDASPDPVAEAFDKLLDASRDPRGQAKPSEDASSLGVKYTATRKGLRVVGAMEKGPTVLEKGAKLNKGDLILRVGNRACYGNNTNLNVLVNSAYKSGNRELLVYEAKTRQVQTYQLPSLQDSGTIGAKTEGTGPVPAAK